ncbi:MAG: hypothetical protein ABIK37_06520, partial [candidate division WOR-3 bacterium]
PGFAKGVAVSGNYAYVADGWAGLRIIDVSNPQSPFEAGYYRKWGWGRGVAVSGTHAHLANGDAGLRIIEFLGGGVEETPNPEPRMPNPAPTVVRGVLHLPASLITHHSSLITSDGRKVMELRPGANDLAALAPGVYFVRPQTGSITRIVLVK